MSTAEEEPTARSFQSTLPTIFVDDGELGKQVDTAWEALAESLNTDNPPLMVMRDQVVRATPEGTLSPFDTVSLQVLLSRVARFGAISPQGDFSARNPPKDVAMGIINATSDTYAGAPLVDFITDVPVVGPDGSIVSRAGYHRDARLFFTPKFEVPEFHAESDEDVTDARDFLLNDLLGDFAFADQSSRANALGLLLLPFVREFIGDAPTPLHAIIANEPGTGKTWLARAALTPALGDPGFTPEVKTSEELRKHITASLAAGHRSIVFDNVRDALDSGILAMALTASVWRDRKLGETTELVLPVKTVWCMTANNPTFSDELTRRTIPIFLDAGTIRPFERPKGSYRHPDLPEWARQNRPKLVAAALTLVKHWLDGDARITPSGDFIRDEQRTATDMTLGSFERWSAVVGGILRACGVEGFGQNTSRLESEGNQERDELATFLRAWREWTTEPVTSSVLAQACGPMGQLNDYVPTDLLEVHPSRIEHKLRYWLRSNRNRLAGGLRLVAQDGGRGRNMWMVVA